VTPPTRFRSLSAGSWLDPPGDPRIESADAERQARLRLLRRGTTSGRGTVDCPRDGSPCALSATHAYGLDQLALFQDGGPRPVEQRDGDWALRPGEGDDLFFGDHPFGGQLFAGTLLEVRLTASQLAPPRLLRSLPTLWSAGPVFDDG